MRCDTRDAVPRPFNEMIRHTQSGRLIKSLSEEIPPTGEAPARPQSARSRGNVYTGRHLGHSNSTSQLNLLAIPDDTVSSWWGTLLVWCARVVARIDLRQFSNQHTSNQTQTLESDKADSQPPQKPVSAAPTARLASLARCTTSGRAEIACRLS